MAGEEEQQTLWETAWRSDDGELEGARMALDAAREAWTQTRRRHAIGAPEEERAWNAYRAASDGLWSLRRQRRMP